VAGGDKVLGLFVGTVTDLGHRGLSLKSSSDLDISSGFMIVRSRQWTVLAGSFLLFLLLILLLLGSIKISISSI
jgi:hypothetical protein